MDTSYITDIICNSVTGGCIRRTVAPPPPTESPPPITSSPTHRKTCTDEEVRSAACFPGQGQCYAVELQGERKSFCSCFEDWAGKRCQEKQIPWEWLESRSADQIRTANIAAGVSISIFIIVIAFLVIFIYIKRNRRNGQACISKDPEGHNNNSCSGNVRESLNGPHKNNNCQAADNEDRNDYGNGSQTQCLNPLQNNANSNSLVHITTV